MSLRIKGVIVPLLTPFDHRGALDHGATEGLVQFLIERGIKGLLPCGTTGEGPLLLAEERRALAETVVRAANGRVPVIIHTGAITTREAIELTQHAQACGATGAALVTPFYFHFSDEALFRHFSQVCEAVPDFPIYLYNNPAVTGNYISAELVARLVEARPNIVGMKDSGGQLENLFRCVTLRDGTFNTASGNDGDLLAAMALGMDACVSGTANFIPELVTALFEAASSGDLDRARPLQQRLNTVRDILEDGRDLSLFKAVLGQRGLPVGAVRAPLLLAPEDVVRRKWIELQALDLGFV